MSALWCDTHPGASYRIRAVSAPDSARPSSRSISGSKHSPSPVTIGGPVVHLGVDVVGPVAGPHRAAVLVPDALQVGRLRPRAGGRHQQVTAEVEHQRDQIRIVAPGSDRLDPLIGRQLHRVAEWQLRAFVEREVVVDVPIPKLVQGNRIQQSRLPRATRRRDRDRAARTSLRRCWPPTPRRSDYRRRDGDALLRHRYAAAIVSPRAARHRTRCRALRRTGSGPDSAGTRWSDPTAHARRHHRCRRQHPRAPGAH